jgi:hypothetical protein
MGYTHYLNIEKKALTKDEFCKVAFDMKLIEQHLNDNDIQLGSWDGETEGVEFDFNELNVEAFRFNGIKETSNETFSLKIGDEGFSFCKTARKEYDIAVCLILLSVKYHVRRAVIDRVMVIMKIGIQHLIYSKPYFQCGVKHSNSEIGLWIVKKMMVR